jgi:membrane protein DedA with SNARE-associated domain
MTVPAQLLAWVIEYGYLAAFVGVLLEGETVLVLAGMAAHRGYLHVSILFLVGAAGAMSTDHFFFALGRLFGSSLLARFPWLAPSIGRAQSILARFPCTAVLAMRFLYGTRTVGPALLGTGALSWARFAVLDAVAACLWCGCWLAAGYVLGEVVEQSLQDAVGAGRWIVLGAAAVIAALALILRRSRRRTRDELASKPGELM